MDIIKKISVGGCVNFYKLHRADERDSLFYHEKCITEGETLWKFHYDGWMYDGEPDLVFDNDRRVNGAESYLRFKIEDLIG